MHSMKHSDYLALRENATVLEADGSGDKVLLLANGDILKLFRRKRLLSSALLFPYAKRFADNIAALEQRQIRCPHMVDTYRIGSIKRDAVRYEPLAGITLRQAIKQNNEGDALRAKLGAFIARLHDQGVYFRSLHLGNVILTPDNALGLIDISDMRCQNPSLSRSKRLRNFQHLLRYKEDRAWLLGEDAGATFLNAYIQSLEAPIRSPRFVSDLQAMLG
ncbi:lipopolysaccharide kinase InaA family protein [Pseudomonas sp. F3-2]|uniref:lipopolysaccharide kinase InaA family protein n=1 Tax=Pseudomonas sp. F3-2 TaxID=3141539 RepID=UPI00315DA84A